MDEARDARELLPLTPLSLSILVSLLDGERHGYAIIKELERQTGGRLVPGAGSLYAALQRMLDEGLIEESEGGADATADARRRYYALTPFGREVARQEMLRLAELLRLASEKQLVPELLLVTRPAG